MVGPGINYTSSSLNRAKRFYNRPQKEVPAYPRVPPGYAPAQPRPLFAYLASPVVWNNVESEGDEGDENGASRKGGGNGEGMVGEGGAESESGSVAEDGGQSSTNIRSHTRASTGNRPTSANPAGPKPILKTRTFDFGFSWAKQLPPATIPATTGGGSRRMAGGPAEERLGGQGRVKGVGWNEKEVGGDTQKGKALWWMSWRGDELREPQIQTGRGAHQGGTSHYHLKRPAAGQKQDSWHEMKRARRPPHQHRPALPISGLSSL